MKNPFNSLTRNLRFAIGLIAVLLIPFTSVMAQGNHNGTGRGDASPEDRAKRQTEMMKENLSLTAAQEPKVSAINLKYAKKMEDVRKVADTTAQRKAAENISKQKEGELKAVLTSDQFKSYLKFVEEMKARRRGMQH
jgi:Spy/CpxP family protein refolding chaperone